MREHWLAQGRERARATHGLEHDGLVAALELGLAITARQDDAVTYVADHDNLDDEAHLARACSLYLGLELLLDCRCRKQGASVRLRAERGARSCFASPAPLTACLGAPSLLQQRSILLKLQSMLYHCPSSLYGLLSSSPSPASSSQASRPAVPGY